MKPISFERTKSGYILHVTASLSTSDTLLKACVDRSTCSGAALASFVCQSAPAQPVCWADIIFDLKIFIVAADSTCSATVALLTDTALKTGFQSFQSLHVYYPQLAGKMAAIINCTHGGCRETLHAPFLRSTLLTKGNCRVNDAKCYWMGD